MEFQVRFGLTEFEKNYFVGVIKLAEQAAYERGKRDGDRKLREEASRGHYTPDREAWYERRIAEAYIQGKLDGLKEGDSCTAKSMEIARDAGLEEGARIVEIYLLAPPALQDRIKLADQIRARKR